MAFENYYAIRARLSLQESLGKYNHCIAIRIKIQTRWLDSTILWSTIWFNIMLTKKIYIGTRKKLNASNLVSKKINDELTFSFKNINRNWNNNSCVVYDASLMACKKCLREKSEPPFFPGPNLWQKCCQQIWWPVVPGWELVSTLTRNPAKTKMIKMLLMNFPINPFVRLLVGL